MNPTILVIDDSPDIHALLRVRLRPEEVRLECALDARTGLRMARELQPDLILLDVDLGDASGFDVCRVLKFEDATSRLPVIFLTGAGDVQAKVQGFELGAVDYVTKPFEPAELRARVRAALRTKRYQDLLAERARVDGLTGLWNRAHFDLRLAEEMSHQPRSGRPVSLLLVDVDHFKRVNDTHGHPFGDTVLRTVAATLALGRREADVTCRYGGEEFAIILPGTDAAGAIATAERVRVDIASLRLKREGQPVPVTASIGLAAVEHSRPDAASPAQLVEAADRALYAAKQGGRDRVCVAPGPLAMAG